MTVITEQVHEHSYRSRPDDGLYYKATLSVRVDDVTRVVSAVIATNPGPRDVRVVVQGPDVTKRTEQTIPKNTPTITVNIPAGRRFVYRVPLNDETVPEWNVGMGEV